MAQYKIIGSYQIVDVAPNPDVVLAPSPSTFYTFSFDTAQQLKQFVIDNANNVSAGSSAIATQNATIATQVAT
jgi:hypothetical protein